MFQNLRHDAASFLPTDAEPTNLAQELLTGLLNNQTFRDTVTSVATLIQREDIAAEINNTDIGTSPRDEIANTLVTAAVNGNEATLVDLTKRPDIPILSLEQLEKFWNVDAFITIEAPHIHTHVQANPKYVAFFDQYVAAKEMSGDAITALRTEVVTAHETASATLDSIEFDGIQMANYGAASGFYEMLETDNLDALGYDELPEQNIFNGLGVTNPISAEELTEVTAPLPHIAIQDAKNEIADSVPTVVESEAVEPEPNQELNQEFNQESIPEPHQEPEPEPELEPEPQSTIYTVQSGDNLWNIAKDEYSLDSYKDIMRAVDHMAAANGLSHGVDANWIQIGQKITMPTAEQITQAITPLNWQALYEDTQANISSQASGAPAMDQRMAAAPNFN